ncbi:hypothetical protein R1sor_008273 [Riccia sorocarpa]|uniref:Uncharacterized protein n=1 Tax=Riccia sorocarpa TaxID=122646 RepID=A0ABD3HSW5_9MARC
MLVPVICASPRLELDEERCELTVRSWAEKELGTPERQQKQNLQDLLYFMHIPRTGGRTFYECFLKGLFEPSERCQISYAYDRLRLDTSRSGCRLVSAHDDYSLMAKLPQGKSACATNLRDPLSRVLSTYEFSAALATVSLKFLKPRFNPRHPSSAHTDVDFRMRISSTPYVWPWNYLVEFVQKDISVRLRIARQTQTVQDVHLPVMPFEEFIHQPIAHELVHNAATFQVAGLTNNSYLKEAKEIRACAIHHPHLGRWVLDVAKRKLDNMLYVGLTERQEESVKLLANILGHQVLSKDGTKLSRAWKTATGNSVGSSGVFSLTSESETTRKDVIDQALISYPGCVKNMSKQIPDMKPMDRKLIPKHVLDEVKRLNSLDLQLYFHAQVLFQKQQDSLKYPRRHEEQLDAMAKVKSRVWSIKLDTVDMPGIKHERKHHHHLDFYIGGFTTFVFLLGFAVFIFVPSTKRPVKVKSKGH